MSEKRNIVLITLDSVRADHCSFMGYHRETTPNIDRMARKGLYFENAIAPSVGTPASLSGIFTGNYSLVDATETNPKPWRREINRQKTLAQVLSEKGYITGAFNPNAFVSSYYGFNKGFSYFEDFLNSGEQSSKGALRRLHAKIFDKVAKQGKKGIFFTLRNLMMFLGKEEIFRSWESYYDLILKWISKVSNPFFLWVLIIDTHHPYLAPRRFRKYSNFFEMWYSNYKLQKVKWKNKLSPREREWLMNAYDDSIRYADSFIGRLWNDLKDFDPVFIIHADHGEGFCEHGLYGHGPFLYEEFVHVPLVIYNADAKGRIDKPVSLRGLAPTILELIGEENEFPSESFSHGGRDWVISKVFEGEKRKVAVRTKDWKFITGQEEEDELYYLKEDPYEQENVINEYPELAKEMRRIVEIHVKQEVERRRIRTILKKLRGFK